MLVRRHVYYYGEVQGVGFRYTARGLARGRAVAGFVRNVSDGRVELVAEGEEAEVAALLRDIDEAMAGYIDRREVMDEPPTGQFATFGIAH
jgi:acylphosphatase